jgi:DNA-binding beta-propeller fold protein YncE
MTLELAGYVGLPPHIKQGGFDHAAVHTQLNRVYVAHTASDTIDVIDCSQDRYLRSIPGLAGVAGALVSEERNLIFTSNRAENTVGVFRPDDESGLAKIPVGIGPNGLAYDPQSDLLLSAHVGSPAAADSTTVSLIQVGEKRIVATIPVPGRTRWTVFDRVSRAFYVNIAHPAEIIVIKADYPTQIARTYSIPVAGPHGLDIDAARQHLFCACDGGKLVTLDISVGHVLQEVEISGAPDVIFFNSALHHLYIAIGDPGVIEVFDTHTLERIETVKTEKGAHTLAFDVSRSKVYAFLPQTHRAAVYADK